MLSKFIDWVVALVLVLSLFACSSPSQKETPSTVPSAPPTPSSEEVETTKRKQELTEHMYGPELKVLGDWIIDNEALVVTSEQPINFVQAYHEQNKITVKNGGYLKIVDSYIRSDFRFLLELHDTSKLIVENSKLIWQGNGAVIINLDSSVVEATDSELDFVGIASGNRPPLYTTVDLSNSSIRQLEIDLFDLANIVVEGLGAGFIQDRTISSERFRMTLKNVNITDEVTAWIGNVEATFRNSNLGQIMASRGSKLNIEKSTVREVVPRVSGYSGHISNLPSGPVSSFRLDLPVTQGPSIYIVDSTIEEGWYFRYDSKSNIEFRNSHLSVLRPMGRNYASVYDSIVKEVWIWDTSGEIRFHNSPIGWIGNVMNYPGQKNDILLSGDITVEDEDWRKRLYHWGETVIRREFFFSLMKGSADFVIKNEEGTIIDQFVIGTSATRRVLVFDREQRHFKVFVNGTYKKTLELSSDTFVLFR